MNRLHILFFFAALCVLISGCNRNPPDIELGVTTDNVTSPSGPGIIWVLYDLIPSHQVHLEVNLDDDIPVPAVNDFLVEKGYTPRVLTTLQSRQGTIIEVIHIGSDIDPSPLFPALQELEHVAFVGLKIEIPSEGETTPF